MEIYLPIAETSANLPLLLAFGAGVGFLAGMVGVGGGFLMTPLLIFLGIPPAIAVSTESTQILATSVSGAISYRARGAVDLRMALILTAGGLVGAMLGVHVFGVLQALGHIDLVIAVLYVIMLGTMGSLMMRESLMTLKSRRDGLAAPSRPRQRRSLAQRLPYKMRFPTSRLHISVLPPLAIGLAVGVLSALMGVGGGFIMVPAMIYLLRMPPNVVVGTSLTQIVVVTAFTVLLQASFNQSIDLVLACILIFSGVIGAQFGVRAGVKLAPEYLRLILASVVLLVCARLIFDLVRPSAERFVIAGVHG